MPRPDLKGVRELLSDLDRQGRELRTATEEAKREREELASLPLCREDVLDTWNAAIDHWRSQAGALLQPAFQSIAARPGKDRENRLQHVPVLPDRDLNFFLLALLPRELKENLREIVDTMPETANAGPPWRERQKRLAELDKQIEEHDKALQELRREVEGSGLRWAGGGIFK